MRALTSEEIEARFLLEEKVSTECKSMAVALERHGVDAVNKARVLLCRYELERYKLFSTRYGAGNYLLMQGILYGMTSAILDSDQIDDALDAMEAPFDDWGDDLAADASGAICNIAENLVDHRDDPVAGVARGMEVHVFSKLNKLYAVTLKNGKSVAPLVADFLAGGEIPAFDFIGSVCREAAGG
jgi:hypothetical protein